MTTTLEDILARDAPPPMVYVRGMVVAGLTFMIGAPKIGKSLFALTFCLQASRGEEVLGNPYFLPIRPLKILYLAMEDDDGSMKDRTERIMGDLGIDDPTSLANVHIEYEWPDLNRRGLAKLEDKIILGGYDVVIIDTFAHVYPDLEKGGGNVSVKEAKLVKPVLQLSRRTNAAIIVTHHDSKGRYDDLIQSINGTTGLAGVVDNFLFVHRPNRWKPPGKLSITGRRIYPSSEYHLDFGGHAVKCPGSWEDSDVVASDKREQVRIYLRDVGAAHYKHMAADLGWKPNTTFKLLQRLSKEDEGLVVDMGGGKFSVSIH